jgi:hypothetical protein
MVNRRSSANSVSHPWSCSSTRWWCSASALTRPSSPPTSTWTAGWPTSAPTGAPAPWPGPPHYCATTSDPLSAPGRSNSSPRWRSRPSTTTSPSAAAGTANPGGLAPQHILAVHRCLHRALAQAVTWRLLAHNPATHATPPPLPAPRWWPRHPDQVAMLLEAADPWLGGWTVLAAATGARSGELCGLEWADLDLDAGAIRFRQARPSSTPPSSPTMSMVTAGLGWVAAQGVGRRTAQVHRQQRHPDPATLRGPRAAPSPPPPAPAPPRPRPRPHPRATLGRARPATSPGRAGPCLPHRAGHADQPQPRQPRLRSPGRPRGAGRPPAPATPCPGVRDGGQQGAGQHHRRPAAPRRRRRACPTGGPPPAAPDRAPLGWGDRKSVWPRGACWAVSAGRRAEGK